MRARAWPAVLLLLALPACTDLKSRFGSKPEPHLVSAVDGVGSPALEQGKLHFANANYGLAERHFRRAVEEQPENTEAWLGLAASYDQLRRFELAERAYGVAVKQVGYTAAIHNNLGYHHYLRGNAAKAREHFAAAQAQDPDNPLVRNNLDLVQAHDG